jgi:hypothetical protein
LKQWIRPIIQLPTKLTIRPLQLPTHHFSQPLTKNVPQTEIPADYISVLERAVKRQLGEIADLREEIRVIKDKAIKDRER